MNLNLIFSRIKGRLISGLLWLTKPATSLPDNLIHQSVLLAWTLLLIIPLALSAIFVLPPEIPQYTGYIGLILGLVFVTVTSFSCIPFRFSADGRSMNVKVLSYLRLIESYFQKLIYKVSLFIGKLFVTHIVPKY